MFVLNNCKRDARVLKEARTLAEAGYDVRIIAVLDETTVPYEEKDGFRIIRVTWDPVHRRVLRAIARGESFAVRLILWLPLWIYQRTGHGITPSSYQIEQPSSSAPTGVEQLSSAAPLENVPPNLAVYRILRRGYLRLRRILYKILATALCPLPRQLSLIDYCNRSWQVVKDEPADIYHSHDLTTLPIGYRAKRRTGGRLVYDSHELFTDLHYIPRMERRVFGWLERHLIHRADAVIIPNEFAADELSRRYGIALPSVVRNCPPLTVQGNERRNSLLRRSLRLDDTVPIIIHIGIFSKSRGSEKLVTALPSLATGVVVFLGWSSGVEEGELKDLVKRLAVEDRVFFAPPVAPHEVVSYISAAQMGVVLFRNVSLNHYYVAPNKLWECMNAGLPVVSSNFPVLKAIVEGYQFGKTCDPEDPEDIAAAINWILADKKRYDEMKRNALEAAKIFNWENESRELLKIYRRLGKQVSVRAT
jgi:glycosyltransferase involved in cell wall biosynthesis